MSAYRDTRHALRALTQTATEQGGYFTAKQARSVGYDYPHLEYHVSAGNFERVGHGLYRLPTIPLSEHDELIRLTLWSRNREDEPQAVVSHETALALHELSDVLPSKTHITVPGGFRKRPPRGCVLHRATLPEQDVGQREGFAVTTPMRTLLDVATTISPEQFGKAVRDALARGLVRRRALVAAFEEAGSMDRLAPVLRAIDGPTKASAKR